MASTFEAASFTAAHVGRGSTLHSVLMESTSVSFLTCTSWLICFFFHQAKVHEAPAVSLELFLVLKKHQEMNRTWTCLHKRFQRRTADETRECDDLVQSWEWRGGGSEKTSRRKWPLSWDLKNKKELASKAFLEEHHRKSLYLPNIWGQLSDLISYYCPTLSVWLDHTGPHRGFPFSQNNILFPPDDMILGPLPP